MVWQDAFPGPVSHLDAEQEREQRLAAQARAGAEWALTALIARYQPPVTRYLTRLTGSPDLAAAIAERVFVRMERRLRGPHGSQNLRLWLLRACTEAGLDALRRPQPADIPRLAGPSGPTALIASRGGASDRMRAGLGALAQITGSTRRQVRQLIWSALPESARGALHPSQDAGPRTAPLDAPESSTADGAASGTPNPLDSELDREDPRETLRYRIVRAVLAELPYGDAQCLALHLVAGLNQAEVARALGITPGAARRRIVQGLQLFSARYEAAVASLGLPRDFLTPDRRTPMPTPDLPLWSRATMPPTAPPLARDPLAPEERPAVTANVPPPPPAAVVEASPPPEEALSAAAAASAEPAVAPESPTGAAHAAGGQPSVQRVVDALPPAPGAAVDEPDELEADTGFAPRIVPVLTRPLPIVLPEPEPETPPPDLAAAAVPGERHDFDTHEPHTDHAAGDDAHTLATPADTPRRSHLPDARIVPVLTRSPHQHIPGTAPAVLPSASSSPPVPRVVPVLTVPAPERGPQPMTEALAEVAAGPRASTHPSEAASTDHTPPSPQQREEHSDA
jgi:RNA polymerase sigma factor (sigma-70 family)